MGKIGSPAGDESTTRSTTERAPATSIGLSDLFGSLEDAEDWIKAIFYGREGSTKTTAAAKAQLLPGDGVVVFINVESGLKKAALKEFVDVSKIMFWPKEDPETGEIPTVTRQMLEDLLLQLKGLTARDPNAVKAVVLDSGTEICNVLMEEISFTAFLAASDNSKLAHRDNKNDIQLKDYQQLNADGRTILRGFRDLPCHFVMTALERDQDLGGDGKELGPEMPPKLAVSALGYVDVVVHFVTEAVETDEGVKRLITGQTSPTARIRAKDRFNILPFQMADPSFDRVVGYIQGELRADNDTTPEFYAELEARGAEFAKARKAARLKR